MFQDPLSLVPYAIAAAGGYLEDVEASRLVTAGLTLLQRSAPLVRALDGKAAALLVPDGAGTVIAIAAAEGRAMHLLSTNTDNATPVSLTASPPIGAVFTTRSFRDRLSEDLTIVYLDDAPWHAEVHSNGRVQRIDLGTHHGLDLIGDTATPGRDEPFVVIDGDTLTHGEVLLEARAAVERFGLTPMHVSKALRPFSTRDGLIHSLIAPLLAGGRVTV